MGKKQRVRRAAMVENTVENCYDYFHFIVCSHFNVEQSVTRVRKRFVPQGMFLFMHYYYKNKNGVHGSPN